MVRVMKTSLRVDQINEQTVRVGGGERERTQQQRVAKDVERH